MTRWSVAISLVLVLLGSFACAGSGPQEPAYRSPTTESGRTLLAALDRVWERTVERSAFFAGRFGRPLETLPQRTFAATRAEADFAKEVLASLEDVDEAELTHREKLALWTLQWRLEQAAEAVSHHWMGFDLTPYASELPLFHAAYATARLETEEDRERYLRLISEYARWLTQVVNRLRSQARREIVMPRAEVELIRPILETYRGADGSSPLAVSTDRLSALSPEDAEAFVASVDQAISVEVTPAWDLLLTYMDDRYSKKARRPVGLWQYPGGEAFYRWSVRTFTTLDVTPEEVHEAGLLEIGRIVRGMRRVRADLGFSGDHRAFAEMARKRPSFRPKDAEEMEQRLLAHVALIEEKVPQLFHGGPRAPYGVARLAPELERGLTYGRYHPPSASEPRGIYYFNGKDASRRSLLTSRSLMLHELVPGHHFQVASAYENPELHPYVRETMDSAYTEGWAEYAASLGEEVGLYDEIWQRYGRLASEAFLASRLVVDTGMNHLRWSRREAIAYMSNWTLEDRGQLETETLRYSVDIPGQALSYKMGSLTFLRLREKAKRELGDAFRHP